MRLRSRNVREFDGFVDDDLDVVFDDFEDISFDDAHAEEFFEDELLDHLDFGEWVDIEEMFADNDESWYGEVESAAALAEDFGDDDLDDVDAISGDGRRSWGRVIRPWSWSRRSRRIGRRSRRRAPGATLSSCGGQRCDGHPPRPGRAPDRARRARPCRDVLSLLATGVLLPEVVTPITAGCASPHPRPFRRNSTQGVRNDEMSSNPTHGVARDGL